MTEPLQVLHQLNDHAEELNGLSLKLAELERNLAPVEMEYEEFIAAYEEGLWDQHVHGAKLPPALLRERMARRAMSPDLLGRYMGLVNSRKRMEQRIASLKKTIEAKRSILSAQKEGIV